MRKLTTLLAIPCLAQGIFAQSPTTTASAPADTSLHPIELAEAIKLAQRNAPLAVQARGQLATSSSGLRAAYAAFMPSLTASMAQSQQAGQVVGPPPARELVYQSRPWSYSTGLSATLQLFDGGRRFANVRTARANVNAADANET